MQAAANLFDHSLAIGCPEPGQEVPGEQCSLVVLGHDREIAIRSPSEPQVVGGRADQLTADNDLGRLGATVTLVAIQRELVALVDVGEANLGECDKEQPPVLEENL